MSSEPMPWCHVDEQSTMDQLLRACMLDEEAAEMLNRRIGGTVKQSIEVLQEFYEKMIAAGQAKNPSALFTTWIVMREKRIKSEAKKRSREVAPPPAVPPVPAALVPAPPSGGFVPGVTNSPAWASLDRLARDCVLSYPDRAAIVDMLATLSRKLATPGAVRKPSSLAMHMLKKLRAESTISPQSVTSDMSESTASLSSMSAWSPGDAELVPFASTAPKSTSRPVPSPASLSSPSDPMASTVSQPITPPKVVAVTPPRQAGAAKATAATTALLFSNTPSGRPWGSFTLPTASLSLAPNAAAMSAAALGELPSHLHTWKPFAAPQVPPPFGAATSQPPRVPSVWGERGATGSSRLSPVTTWLATIGLEQYAPMFAADGWDDVAVLAEAVSTRGDAILMGIGVAAGGHRAKMARSLRHLVAPPLPSRPPPGFAVAPSPLR